MNIYNLINNTTDNTSNNITHNITDNTIDNITDNTSNNITDNTTDNINSNTTDNTNDNICLISGLPLDNNHIVLDCNHKFNYVPLYNEYRYQKTNKNVYDSNRPLSYQIKCPYCRNFTNKILPYFKPIIENICLPIPCLNPFENPPTYLAPFFHIFVP